MGVASAVCGSGRVCSASSRRARRSARRGPVAARAGEEPDAYGRTGWQKKLAEIDGAIGARSKAFGQALGSGGLAKAFGVGKGQRSNRESEAPGFASARERLLAAGLRSVPPAEAIAAAEEDGYVIVDVRPSEEYDEYHPRGAVSCPSVRFIDGAAAKRLLLAAQGVRALEEDPGFVDAVKAVKAQGAKGVVLCCASGGTLASSPNFPAGQASRSLFAAARLLDAGVDVEMLHLAGGLNVFFRERGEDAGDGTAEKWDSTAGRMPAVAGFTFEQDNPELM